ACATGSGVLSRHRRVALDAGGPTGLPNGRSYIRVVQRPARSDRERLIIVFTESADYNRAFTFVADQPHVRDGEDAGDLLSDAGKELIRRGLTCDEEGDFL